MGNKITYYRRKLGMTQGELAKKVGVDRTHINKIENGKKQMSMKLVVRIAKALNVTPNDIFLD